MKGNLPEKSFFDSFYIWFNKEKREEYYSTPLYLYSVNRKDDFENKGRYFWVKEKCNIEMVLWKSKGII
mgnify:CR=1 FL=1